MLETIDQHFKKPKPKEDRYDILGKNVALKMRDVSDNTQRLVAEKIINETLFMAEMGQLTQTHTICRSDNSEPNNVSLSPQHINNNNNDGFSQQSGSTYFQLQPALTEGSDSSCQSLASYYSNFGD